MKMEEFTECMQTLAAVIPNRAPADIYATSIAWYPLFQEFSAPAMMAMIYGAANTFNHFPSIKELRELFTGSAEDNAKEVGQKIWAGIERFKSTHNSRWNEIAAFIGPLGVAVVEQMGAGCGLRGWAHLCDTLTNDDRGTFIAQTRDLALSLQQKAKVQRVELPGKVRDEIAKLTDRFSLSHDSGSDKDMAEN